jgi:NhaA family Na+:H+ antiporter
MTSPSPWNSPRPVPPEAWPSLARFVSAAGQPLQRFFRIEAASGILLLLAAAFALAMANSPWAHAFHAFWQTPLGLRVGSFEFARSLEWVVNDGLMVIFFFVVGLEIRREIHQGELSEWRRAALPAVAALGGMIAPALLYLAVAGARETHSGWGVPMATDIAFAVGVLALLGKRVPPALRVLLLALAVIDDLGAIAVIAVFYSSGLRVAGLVVALLGFGLVFALRVLGVRSKLAYVPAGVVIWAGVYASGVHPTIAGVAIGLVTPVRAWLGPSGFVKRMGAYIEDLNRAHLETASSHDVTAALEPVSRMGREALSPAENLISYLHPWVAYLIMPLFAAANAGVTIDSVALEGHTSHVAVGVALGLVIGKPLGVLAASVLAVRVGAAALPIGIGLRHLVVLGVVAGIGFTMALFVAQLAFADAALLSAAKLGVLAASACAGCSALVLGRLLLRTEVAEGAALTEDEAECSTTR